MENLLSTVLNLPALYVSSAVLIAVIVIGFIFVDNNKFVFNTKCIALAGVSIALSICLSFIKLFKLMPEAGSVTACQLLPIFVFTYIYGVRKGLFVGLIVGIINFIVSPYFVHPCQFLLDYILSYTVIGLSGMFISRRIFNSHKVLWFVLGASLSVILRFISLSLAGVFAWETPFWTSLSINSVALVDGLISIVVTCILFSSKTLTKQLENMK